MRNRLVVKICSYRTPQRYSVARTVRAALATLQADWPDLDMEIVEIREVQEILQVTPVLILPSLVVNDRLVCTGRFPKKDEVIAWLRTAAGESQSPEALFTKGKGQERQDESKAS